MDTLIAQSDSSRGLISRLKIIKTAERLYAINGIDATSIREINKAAGQRNGSAVQYHFGNREGLLEAITALRTRAPNHERFVRLHRMKEGLGQSRPTLRELVTIMFEPMFEGLTAGQVTYHRRFFKQVHVHHNTMKKVLANDYDVGLRECFRWIRDTNPETPVAVLAQRYVHSIAVAIDSVAQLEENIEIEQAALSDEDIAFQKACCLDSIVAIFEGPKN